MGTQSDLRHNGSIIRYDSDIFDPFEPRLFDETWLMSEGYHRGSSLGRGQAYFLNFGGRDMVLRPFRRGGLFGKVNRDLYWNTGLENSRSMQEFNLLKWMFGEGLPVPRVVAARMVPFGPAYRAALITERIPTARPLEEVLREKPLEQHDWALVGHVVRMMHDAGVDHSDLNCRNILFDHDHKVWLIDFDKCRRRPSGSWTSANLERLKRSLVKENSKADGLHWTEYDWVALIAGYDGKKSDGAASLP